MTYNILNPLAKLIGGKHPLEQAARLLETYSSLEKLASASLPELRRSGLSRGAAARIEAALELHRSLLEVGRAVERPRIRGAEDAAALLRPKMERLEQEHFYILCLDRRNTLLGEELLYKGSIDRFPVRAAEVFYQAVRHNSAAIVVAHNHPGDHLVPSLNDVMVTRGLIAAGRILGIPVLDHLIFGPEGRWVSLRTLTLATIGPDDRLWGRQDLTPGWGDNPPDLEIKRPVRRSWYQRKSRRPINLKRRGRRSSRTSKLPSDRDRGTEHSRP